MAFEESRRSSSTVLRVRNIAPMMLPLVLQNPPTMTFSRADISAKRRRFWNVLAIPCRVIWWGFRLLIFSPLNLISPLSGDARPVIQLKKVVLPAPLGPMRLMISPGNISSTTPSSAFRPPKYFDTPFASRSGCNRILSDPQPLSFINQPLERNYITTFKP